MVTAAGRFRATSCPSPPFVVGCSFHSISSLWKKKKRVCDSSRLLITTRGLVLKRAI